MTEVVGLVASVATLCEVTKKAYELGRDYHDAPAEMRHAMREALQLSTQSSLICELHNRMSMRSYGSTHQPVLDLCQSLITLKEDIDNINALLLKIIPKNPTNSRLQWILLCKKDATRLLEHLHSCRTSLVTTLSLALCLRYCPEPASSTYCHLEEWKLLRLKPQEKSERLFPTSNPLMPSTNNTDLPKRTDTNLFNDCLSTIFSVAIDEQYSTYGLSVVLMLPYEYVLNLKLIFRVYFAKQFGMTLLSGSSIRISHLVDGDKNQFMVACQRGDVLTMKHMLSNRLAGINDITIAGKVPLSLAIKSGNSEAVKVLLQQGANVNSVYGNHQTSPLATAIRLRHLEITRLLLAHGAYCEYTTAWGWSPLWYLWADTGVAINPPANAFIDLLGGRDDFSLSHNSLVDIQGYGVIHHAVIFGQPNDVISLIKRGVDPYMPAGIMQRDALQNAVYEDRPDVFEALLPYYQHRDIDERDKRGWTLLHTSASMGHDTITRHLLRLGADWQALSIPSYFESPDSLCGKSFTPADAAMGTGGVADGQRRRDVFLKAVEDVNGICVYTSEPPVGADDIWFDAMEEDSSTEIHAQQCD